MSVMTRKATAQVMEVKLRTALEELKASNIQCQQLLQERDDCEEEIKGIIDKNTSLKRELVHLHQQFLDVVDERDKLRVVTDGFNNCSNLYEEALCKVRDLKEELIHANFKISTLVKEKECSQAKETNHLYNELLNSKCNPNSLTTIDLTEDSLVRYNNNSYTVSHNKFKKYAKFNKIIKKCKKFRKQQKHFSSNINLRKERVFLVNKLNNYQIKLEDSTNIYEVDTQRLQSEIEVLERSLHFLSKKYESSQQQIKEHILATNELVGMCSSADRVDPLPHNTTLCTFQTESHLEATQPEITADPSRSESVMECVPNSIVIPDIEHGSSPDLQKDGSLSGNKVCCSSIIFSDSLGKGLGKLLNNNLRHSAFNHCMPGTTYKEIMSTIAKKEYNADSIITVLVGNSINVTIDDITDRVTKIMQINCRKIILCAFPYFEHLSNRQNNNIHKLNNHMHFLVSHYSEKLMFLDINSFVEKLRSTRDTAYLPISFRRQIAWLLAFNINSDIISMSKYSTISTTIFSNNTNVRVVPTNNILN